jgi:glutathione synthase/RimK-type ligase-like ATP-grasp enzyme
MTAEDGPRALAIVTGERAPELTDDGKRVAAWFDERGYTVDPVRWDRPVDWTAYDYALFRSCYEYPSDPAGFRELLDAMERAGVTACNPLPAIRWNVHKSYVTELAAAGVPVPETTVVEQGAETTLAAEMARLALDEAIVKPAVGTGSTGVFRVENPDDAAAADRFDDLLADGDVLVQAFAPDVVAGERSIAVFGGTYSHAWNSPTTPDDVTRFEADDHGYEPSEPVVEAAAETCRAARDVLGLDRPLPYARVDYVRDGDGGIVVLELELVEPILALEAAGAVDRFCEAVRSSFEKQNSGIPTA